MRWVLTSSMEWLSQAKAHSHTELQVSEVLSATAWHDNTQGIITRKSSVMPGSLFLYFCFVKTSSYAIPIMFSIGYIYINIQQYYYFLSLQSIRYLLDQQYFNEKMQKIPFNAVNECSIYHKFVHLWHVFLQMDRWREFLVKFLASHLKDK